MPPDKRGKFKEIKDKISRYFSAKPEIKVGYIFGSAAKGAEHKLSDIDIAILVDAEKLPGDASYKYKAGVIADIIGILKNTKVDLVILNESPLFLCFNVIKDGVILYSNDEMGRIQFEARIMSLYFDQEYYYKRHAKATIDRIATEGIL
ncbi:MAG: nucleotidyltransferase domain-containing protein [Candidatus Omnitrophica bacterium]|nr:nucleotidyltransferase domain-containing protein [Candidatus Omnitrophota bacterium]MBU4457508.1 nucleotidyltransferase domain-containing protein [Candidatus Omnitrophota bacterium]